MKKRYLLSTLILLFIIIAIAVTVYLVKQRQKISSNASVPGGQATVSLSPASQTYQVGDTFPVTINFNTGGLYISAVAVRVKYPYSGSSPEITAAGVTPNSSLLSTGDWSCPVKSVSTSNGMVNIDVACANTSTTGFVTSSNTALATFNLTVNQIPFTNPVILTFDPSQSVITKKSDGQDTLLTPTSSGTYTINHGATATPTPTSMATSTPTPTTSVQATATPTPTQPANPTATPTPTRALTSTPTPTSSPSPSPTQAQTSNPSAPSGSVSVTSVANGQTLGSSTPTFTGKAPANAKVVLTIYSSPQTLTVYADASGSWSARPVQPLTSGSHQLVAQATDASGNTTTAQVSFNVGLPVTASYLPTLIFLISGLIFLFLGLVRLAI